MGYTHYWRREIEVPMQTMQTMQAIVDDFNKVRQELSKVIQFADGMGSGDPIVTTALIRFNGKEKCGHPQEDLGITWPSADAGGIADLNDKEDVTLGNWLKLNNLPTELKSISGMMDMFGQRLRKRRCDGDCSYESVYFPRIVPAEDIKRHEEVQNMRVSMTVITNGKIVKPEELMESRPKDTKIFYFCKTAFKPYDLAVIAFLIIVKHHWGDGITISSDGEDCHWWDGKYICHSILGYGLDFKLDD